MNLKGRTLFVTDASRGIGLAIALRAAADGANIVIAAKTTGTNPKLPGTIHSAAQEIEAAGGRALPVQCDVREESSVQAALAQAVQRFGGIDILVNNASAISMTPTPTTPMKRFDLMFGVNVRGTYLCTQACLPELVKSAKADTQPACAEHVAAVVHARALVRPAFGLHDGQVRHERVHARPRGRVPAAWHRRQQPLATHRDRHCGAADDQEPVEGRARGDKPGRAGRIVDGGGDEITAALHRAQQAVLQGCLGALLHHRKAAQSCTSAPIASDCCSAMGRLSRLPTSVA